MDKIQQIHSSILKIQKKLDNLSSQAASSYKVFTTQQVCELFKITPSTLRQWRKDGLISYSKYSKNIYYSSDDIKNFMERFHIDAKKDSNPKKVEPTDSSK